jgi:hypothetical protein
MTTYKMVLQATNVKYCRSTSEQVFYGCSFFEKALGPEVNNPPSAEFRVGALKRDVRHGSSDSTQASKIVYRTAHRLVVESRIDQTTGGTHYCDAATRSVPPIPGVPFLEWMPHISLLHRSLWRICRTQPIRASL